MDWFLYDRDPHHERVNDNMPSELQQTALQYIDHMR